MVPGWDGFWIGRDRERMTHEDPLVDQHLAMENHHFNGTIHLYSAHKNHSYVKNYQRVSACCEHVNVEVWLVGGWASIAYLILFGSHKKYHTKQGEFMSQGYASLFFNMDWEGHWFAFLGFWAHLDKRFAVPKIWGVPCLQATDPRRPLATWKVKPSSPVWTLLIWQDPFGSKFSPKDG